MGHGNGSSDNRRYMENILSSVRTFSYQIGQSIEHNHSCCDAPCLMLPLCSPIPFCKIALHLQILAPGQQAARTSINIFLDAVSPVHAHKNNSRVSSFL